MVGTVIRFFTENWALKLAAVALAVMLWLAVRAGTPARTVFRQVPVHVDLRDPDWRVRGQPDPATVSVTVTGPTSELMKLANDLPFIMLPVDRVNDSIESQVVPPHWIRLPRDVDRTRVSIVGLRPDTIRVQYERLASRTLPVRVRTRGDLPDGFALSLPISASPSVIEVRGPARVLQDMDSISLFPVDVTGVESTTNVPARVDTTDLRGMRFDPAEVNVVLRVVPQDSQPGLQPEPAPRRRTSSRIR